MKRILIFSLGYYPNHVGGAEVAIKEITDRLTDEYEFHLVCNRYDANLPKSERIGNVLVHRIGLVQKEPSMSDLQKIPLKLNKYLYQFSAAFAALSLHRKYRFDGIWAMMAHSCGVPAAIFKILKPDVPYVLTLQEGDPPEYIEKKAKLIWPLFKRGFTSADVVQVISTFLGSWAKRMGYEGQSVLIPNAVNVAHFSKEYSHAELMAIREELGKKEGDVFLITTSRLVHKNGIDNVIEAVAMLPQNVHFVVYGDGPDRAMLEDLAEEKDVTNRVYFKGYIAHDVMPKYLKACDIFIRPSRSEGMGNSFVEAMVARIPVIATQEGGIADFLFDEKRNPEKETTGWAVNANDPDSITEAVEDIVGRPEKVQGVIETAHAMAVSKYDWDIIARDMKEKVFKVVDQKGRV